MSKDVKKTYVPLGTRVLIKTKLKMVTGGIAMPYKRADFKDMLNRKKDALFMNEIVINKGDEVEKNINKGDEVSVKHYDLIFIEDRILKECGLKYEEDELYYLIDEKYILAKLS